MLTGQETPQAVTLCLYPMKCMITEHSLTPAVTAGLQCKCGADTAQPDEFLLALKNCFSLTVHTQSTRQELYSLSSSCVVLLLTYHSMASLAMSQLLKHDKPLHRTRYSHVILVPGRFFLALLNANPANLWEGISPLCTSVSFSVKMKSHLRGLT
jgi:hypothetical protein